MRARVNATGLAIDTNAQVACRRLAVGFSSLVIHAVVHIDIAVGAILRTQPTTNAMFLDLNLQGGTLAMDGVHRTSDEAVGIHTGAAGASHEKPIKSHVRQQRKRGRFVSDWLHRSNTSPGITAML